MARRLGYAVALCALVGSLQVAYALLPGFEGMNNGIYGYQPSAKPVASLGNTLLTPSGACSYSYFGTPTISTEVVKATTPSVFGSTCAITDSDQLEVDMQTNPVPYQPPFSSPIVINYYVPNPTLPGQKMHVRGQVNEYTYNVNVLIESGSSGRWSFPGDTIWANLAAVAWNQASIDPTTGVSGSVFEAPLYAVVTNAQWSNQGTSGCSACVVGETLNFYSSASTTGQTLVTLTGNQPPTSSFNQTLSSVYAPDSRLQQLVYYPISIQGMASSCPIVAYSCAYPSIAITVTLYTLQIGEYILTNPSTTGLGGNNPPCTGTGCFVAYFNGLVAWVSNPWNQLLAGLFGIPFILIVLVIVFAPGLLILLATTATRRRQS